ncbi:MAG TPA: hypothetical protein VET24_00405 [Actinomycetota bacterium]|nr:hypothetical protein [Actinomycetota bacterium]
MSAPATLLLFGDEQISFPGIPHDGGMQAATREPASASASALASGDHSPEPARACPGQLCLGPVQMLLAEADPEPRQPSLLPEPPLWETPDPVHRVPVQDPPARAAAVRQLHLFPLQLPRLTAS